MNSSSNSQGHFASVIVPVFNNVEGLHECLNGLRRQTVSATSFEVIIVDNGSRPPVAISGGFPFKIGIVRCLTPGSYAARNAGARAAIGEIFAFVDADCVPNEQWLEKGINAILSKKWGSIVGGDVVVDEPTKRTGVGLYQYAVGFQQRENIEIKGFTVTANMFCSAAQFYRVGAFDERLMSGGDREWAWRARQHGFAVTFEPTAFVITRPRTSLVPAIRQARRVSSGRLYIRRYQLAHLATQDLQPHRSVTAAIWWIITLRQLSIWERAKVLIAATLIKTAAAAELLRLRVGGRAERR